MKSKYRFRHPTGRVIQVTFAHIPSKWFSTGTHNMTEAVLWAEKKLLNDIGITSQKKDLTLKEFADGFFIEDKQGYRKRNEKRNKYYTDMYYVAHQSRLDNYIIPKFGDFLLSVISDVMIEDWFVDLHSYKSGKELADDSKNKVLFCFRIVLQEAKRQRYIKVNPAASVQEITSRHVPRDHFTEIELFKMFPRNEEELLRIWGSRKWATYFLVMRDTGFRPGEVAGLARKSFNQQYKGLYTEQSINFRTREAVKRIKTSGKGKNYKVGLLTNQTIEQLMKHIQEQEITEDDALIFLVNGRAIIPETANKHLKLSLKKTDVKLNGRTQYSLRHSFETALAGNIDQKILLELMAHTNFRKEYDHRTPEDILKQLQPAWEVIEKRS